MFASLPITVLSLFAMMGAVQAAGLPSADSLRREAEPVDASALPVDRRDPFVIQDTCFYGKGQCCDRVPVAGYTKDEALDIYQTLTGDMSRNVAPLELSGKNCVSSGTWPACHYGTTPLCCGGAGWGMAHSCIDASSVDWL